MRVVKTKASLSAGQSLENLAYSSRPMPRMTDCEVLPFPTQEGTYDPASQNNMLLIFLALHVGFSQVSQIVNKCAAAHLFTCTKPLQHRAGAEASASPTAQQLGGESPLPYLTEVIVSRRREIDMLYERRKALRSRLVGGGCKLR